MRFAFNDEQELLRRQAREVLGDDRAPSWSQLAELGWTGVSVPEELGGAGLGFLEEAVLFEELGRVLYEGPYFATVGLALPALPPESQKLVARGERTFSVALDGRPAPDRELVDEIVRVEGGDLAERIRRRSLAALALEATGVAQRALELGVEHGRTRMQFGRPIGVYQAVSHPLADAYVEIELARSLAYWAAWCVAEDDRQAEVAVAAAMARAGDTAIAACERSMQVHGGIGFTWEHPLRRYYARAQRIQALGGYARTHRASVAGFLLG